MACGCAGSTPREARQERQARVTAQQPRERRRGGPGEVGYTWNGPQGRRVPATPQPSAPAK